MPAELGELRIKPVGLDDGCLEVVDHERVSDTTEVLEGVLKATNEVVGRLCKHSLAVALAGMREHDPQDVRSPPLAIATDDGSPRAEVNLSLKPRRHFHPPKGHRLRSAVLLQQPSDTVVSDRCSTRKLSPQILVNPLRGESSIPLRKDPREPPCSRVAAAR